MAGLALIRRYPIKGIGGESVPQAMLKASRPLTGDRLWGLLHEGGAQHLDKAPHWLPKSCFLQGARAPAMQAIRGGWGAGQPEDQITLTHPDRPDLTFSPAKDGQKLIDWITPLWPDDLPAPVALMPAPTAFTDTNQPYVSLLSLSSLTALEQALGRKVGTDRWRANLWIDGWPPRFEDDLIGRILHIGKVELRVAEPIRRCAATSADPRTGQIDMDMPAALTRIHGSKNFGVYAQVITGGMIRPGDQVTP